MRPANILLLSVIFLICHCNERSQAEKSATENQNPVTPPENPSTGPTLPPLVSPATGQWQDYVSTIPQAVPDGDHSIRALSRDWAVVTWFEENHTVWKIRSVCLKTSDCPKTEETTVHASALFPAAAVERGGEPTVFHTVFCARQTRTEWFDLKIQQWRLDPLSGNLQAENEFSRTVWYIPEMELKYFPVGDKLVLIYHHTERPPSNNHRLHGMIFHTSPELSLVDESHLNQGNNWHPAAIASNDQFLVLIWDLMDYDQQGKLAVKTIDLSRPLSVQTTPETLIEMPGLFLASPDVAMDENRAVLVWQSTRPTRKVFGVVWDFHGGRFISPIRQISEQVPGNNPTISMEDQEALVSFTSQKEDESLDTVINLWDFRQNPTGEFLEFILPGFLADNTGDIPALLQFRKEDEILLLHQVMRPSIEIDFRQFNIFSGGFNPSPSGKIVRAITDNFVTDIRGYRQGDRILFLYAEGNPAHGYQKKFLVWNF